MTIACNIPLSPTKERLLRAKHGLLFFLCNSAFTKKKSLPVSLLETEAASFLFLDAVVRLHSERVMADGVVNYTGYAQYDDARRANQQAGASVVVTAERDNRGVVRGDVHGFYHT